MARRILFALSSIPQQFDLGIRLKDTMNETYVHGYNQRENIRLQDQASTLVDLLHSDTSFPAESKVLEAGCGVGSQTVTLARNSPNAHITSIDISEASVAEAKKRVESEGFSNVNFQQGNIFNLSYQTESFDHIFVCFVLEHLPNPIEALSTLKRYIKPGGTMTVKVLRTSTEPQRMMVFFAILFSKQLRKRDNHITNRLGTQTRTGPVVNSQIERHAY